MWPTRFTISLKMSWNMSKMKWESQGEDTEGDMLAEDCSMQQQLGKLKLAILN